MRGPLIPLFLFGLAAGLLAQEPAPTAAPAVFDPDADVLKMLRSQIEFIEVSHESLGPLLSNQGKGSPDGATLRARAQELVTKGEAKLFETLIATGRSGARLSVQSGSRYTFPTEYDSPAVAAGKKPEASAQSSPAPAPEVQAFVPSAFDTTNVGSQLEIEPTMGEDGKTIALTVESQIIWHTGETIWTELKDPLGNVSKIQVPRLYELRFNSSFICRSGGCLFLHTLSPKDQAGEIDRNRKFLVFVKCEEVPIP